MGIVNIGRGRVPRSDGVAHPLFVPRSLVHPVVVTAACGGSHLVEFGMKQDTASRVLAAGRDAINSHAVDIVTGIFLGGGSVPEDAVREASVFQVMPADVVKGFGAIGGSHAINLNDDEPQVGQKRE